jgi:protein-tyrosine phosphatase
VIDLHSHVLPGIDDGAGTEAESIELLRVAAAAGTRTIAATPHARADFPDVRLEELAARCKNLREALPGSLQVDIVPAAEVDAAWAHAATDEELRLASYGQRGTDLLLETPYGPLVPAFEKLVFRLMVEGFRVLLAHPERNVSFQREPGRLAELVRRGALVQLTVPSLAGRGGRSRSRRLALELVKSGLCHNLASDAHSPGPWRSPDLQSGVEVVANVAPARAEWMVTDAAAAILAGEALPAPPAERPRGRRLPWRRS